VDKQASPLKALQNWLARTPEAGALIGFLAVFIFFTLTTPLFFSMDSVSTILTKQATSGIVAIGVAMLMISGEFDLSVGSILAVSSLFFLSLVAANVPAPLAAIIGILTGMSLGLINGLLLVWTRIPSFIVTLGTLQAYRAIALVGIRGGRVMRYNDYFSEPPYVYFHPLVIILFAMFVIAIVVFIGFKLFPGYFRALQRSIGLSKIGPLLRILFLAAASLLVIGALGTIGLNQVQNVGSNTLVEVSFFDLLNGRLNFTAVENIIGDSNFRMSIVWWSLIAIVFTLILTKTRYGNAVYATGGNAGAARAQGIPVDSVRITNFVITGGLSALAGVIAVGRELSVFPLQAQGLELEVIAATVIGGTLLSGGYGSIIGAILGVIITGALSTGLVLLGVPAEIFQGVIGILLIITVIINTSVRGQNNLFGNLRIRRRSTPAPSTTAATSQVKEKV
jgi:ribose/xylose/arabinose/galactoside ABC-type transport system permease subunit